MRYTVLLSVITFFLCFHLDVQKKQEQVVELKKYALDNMDGIITQTGVEIDTSISSDGKGSLKVTALQPVVVNLFETGPIDVENNRVVYKAKVRTENVSGKVYLEMWCHFPDKGEFFSKGLESSLVGTTQWTSQEIAFVLQKGQKPDNVKLNLVIEGTGTVWIDDITLLKTPLQ